MRPYNEESGEWLDRKKTPAVTSSIGWAPPIRVRTPRPRLRPPPEIRRRPMTDVVTKGARTRDAMIRAGLFSSGLRPAFDSLR
jgi:hypothetical protein